jgi:hypothetical protein
MTYSISVQRAVPRLLAAVRERMAVRNVPARFRPFLDQVYAMGRSHALALDGQNVFVYRFVSPDEADVDFGVGVREPFEAIGRVACVETPAGDVATTTHWGDYAGLGAAHRAVLEWCKTERRPLTGVSWEVYGHWYDDPAKVRTDVYHLLRSEDH